MIELVGLGLSLLTAGFGIFNQNQKNDAQATADKAAVDTQTLQSEVDQLDADASVTRTRRLNALALAQATKTAADSELARQVLVQKLLFGAALLAGMMAMFILIRKRVSA